ncbi:MAG: hypothetical protein RLZZ210_1708 [Pseudomonadota bacterium]|jgi:uncharacterized membrane protein
MIKRLSKLKNKIYSTIAIGHALAINTVYAQELSGEDDTAIINALKWMLKVGGWISIVLFIIGVLTYLGMDSGNSKNVIMTILTFAFSIILVGWAVNLFDNKMDAISNQIFN